MLTFGMGGNNCNGQGVVDLRFALKVKKLKFKIKKVNVKCKK